MCTALTFYDGEHYFGRTLDLEYRYAEEVVITPRAFPLPLRYAPTSARHYALIGMATVADGYPLYYEAANERGLAMAGLNFPHSAYYPPSCGATDEIAPFELIPYLLGQCGTVEEAVKRLHTVRLAAIPFGERFPLSPLHWMLCDRTRAVVIEPMADGLHIHENPVGVLTNEPPFDTQMLWLSNFMHVTREEAQNRLAPSLPLRAYSRGMGGMGLPGDLSSASRFVRAAFTRANAVCKSSEEERVECFFHILGTVEQVCGCVRVGDALEKTVYTSCCNTDRGIYYYTTYDSRRIRAVRLHAADLEEDTLLRFSLTQAGHILYQN